jgi:putative hydrolase of the HAD superfamily
MYKIIMKSFILTWKDLFNDFEMHFYRYVFPYYDTLYTLERLSKADYIFGCGLRKPTVSDVDK